GRKWMKLSGEQGSKLFSVMGNAMHSLKTLFSGKTHLDAGCDRSGYRSAAEQLCKNGYGGE
ncbi:hypothetical protein, partial [Escherichia coli]|uniref:hypothetical protein n=1 Tax=Escherichia coli TaxID=562 RepID=UPI00203CFFB6